MGNCTIIGGCDSRPLSDFITDILFNSPGATPDIAEYYALQAAIEFCERSKIIRETIAVDLQACVSDIILEPECDLRVVYFHDICGTRLGNSHGSCACGGIGGSITYRPPNMLHISPRPVEDRYAAFSIYVSLAPKQNACSLPGLLYEEHLQAITAGAMAKLHLVKETKFFDESLAKDRRTEFNAKVAAANVDRLTGRQLGPYNMRPRARIV